MNKQLISAFIESTEGEKDPRCLYIELQIYPLIYKLYKNEISEMAEEIMDNLLAYFPVTFTTKPNESFTKVFHIYLQEEFVHVFYLSLISHPSLLEYIFPEITEKISSPLIQAKHDSVELINEIVKMYGIKEIKDYLPTFIPLLIETYSDRNNKGVLTICEECIENLTKSIINTNDNSEYLELFIQPIIQKCLDSIKSFAINDITDITMKIIIIVYN